MAAIRQLKNPPITEAIIDIRVDLPSDITADTLSALAHSYRQDFPDIRERRQIKGELKMGPGTAAEARTQDLGVDGFFLRSTDKLNIVQFRMDGMTINRLAPYQGWGALLASAQKSFAAYSAAMKPLAIKRVATRFINRILLPFPIAEVADYMVCPPQIPENLPQHLSGFFTHVVVTDPETGNEAGLNQLCEPPKESVLPWILDVDAYYARPLSPNDETVWKRLESLHDFKNRAFYGLITDKTAGLLT